MPRINRKKRSCSENALKRYYRELVDMNNNREVQIEPVERLSQEINELNMSIEINSHEKGCQTDFFYEDKSTQTSL